MKRLAALLFTALTVCSQAFAATAPPAETRTSRPNQSVLFAHDADGGTFEAIAGRREYRLTLAGVSPRALYFENRPGVHSGEESLARVLAGFFDKPGAAVPNAAVNVVDLGGRQRLMAVKLLSARYDRRRATIRYRVRALSGAKNARLPRRFGETSVFIDTFWNRCTAGITNGTSENMNYAGSTIGSHDSWGNDYLPGVNRPTQQTLVPAQPGSGWSSDVWGDTSGFARGCSIDVRYAMPSGAIVDVSVSSPYSSSNTYSCTVSDPKYVCLQASSPPAPSSFSGPDVAAFFMLQPAQ
jgi:hypothetical protein